jgi:hypothetical protein
MSVNAAVSSRGLAGRFFSTLALTFGLLLAAFSAQAGNLWLTGHDADLHCNGSGSQCNYFGIAANFVRQSAPTKTLPILVLDSGTQVQNSLDGAIARSKNTVEGPGAAIPYTVVDPTSPAFATTPINVATFSAIIIASDSSCGGCDNDAADIAAIQARVSEIQAFFTAGGGLLYLAGASDRGTYYGTVPIPTTGVAVSAPFTVQAPGAALGLTDADVNCCATHNSFNIPPAGSALVVAETDSAGFAETLIATGAAICPGGICGAGGEVALLPVPTMSEWSMIVMALLIASFGWITLRRRSRR